MPFLSIQILLFFSSNGNLRRTVLQVSHLKNKTSLFFAQKYALNSVCRLPVIRNDISFSNAKSQSDESSIMSKQFLQKFIKHLQQVFGGFIWPFQKIILYARIEALKACRDKRIATYCIFKHVLANSFEKSGHTQIAFRTKLQHKGIWDSLLRLEEGSTTRLLKLTFQYFSKSFQFDYVCNYREF